MNKWPVKLLGELCTINPRLPKNHKISDNQGVSFVPMAAVDEVSGTIIERRVRPFIEVKKGFTYFQEDDVLFAKITPCMENGKAAIARNLIGGFGFGSTEFHVLRAGDKVLFDWVFYFVRQQNFRNEAKRNFTGTAGQQRVPTTFMGLAQVPVPPVYEQHRLVDILSRAEGIVRLRREAQKKAQELIPALFLDMFGDPATNPKGWPIMPLLEVAEIISGVTKGRRIDFKESISLPYVRVANVQDGHLNLAEIKYIEVKPNEIEKYRLELGDLLMTEGGDPDKLGRAALWNGEIEHCLHQNHVFKVRANRKLVFPEYLCALIGSEYGKRYFLQVAKRTTGIASINKTQLGSFPVLIPPLIQQIEFTNRVIQARSIQSQQSLALEKAEATFQSLLHRALAGQL